LKEYINDDQIIKSLGGSNPYDYTYVPPSPEDIEIEKKNKDSNNPEKFQRIEEWRNVVKEYEEATKKWIEANRELDAQLRAENANNPESLLKVEKIKGNSNSNSNENLSIANKDQLIKNAEELEKKRKEIGEKHKKSFNKLIPYVYTKTYYQRVNIFEYIKEEEL